MPWLLIANIVLFQVGWFACVTLAYSWSLPLVTIVSLLHFMVVVPQASVSENNNRLSEAILLLQVVAIGVVLECAYLFLSVLVRVDGLFWPPIWLLAIWLLFGMTLRYSLSWLRKKIFLSSLFAAIAGPASYYAGVQLNDCLLYTSPSPRDRG